MRIVVVGQGGREHALAWRLASEGAEVVAIPGNPGIERVARCVDVPMTDVAALAAACREAQPRLVVIGPEAPLAAGLADQLRADGLTVFGPSAKAARIESSKAFSKQIMQKAGVPTAEFVVAEDLATLEMAVERFEGAVAVKADGLAAGKGVIVCSKVGEAKAAGRSLLSRGPVVVEERLSGPEISVIALTDGRGVAVLPTARDHKRLLDGDRGPNTGGMGAVCPVEVEPALFDSLRERVFLPTLRALAAEGAPFNGALYAGLMLDPRGFRVLEFNARFGDPETQAIMVALSRQVSLGEQLLAAAEGRLRDAVLPAEGAACCVVLAAAGYPDSPRTGDPILGFGEAESSGAIVFHAGTRRVGGNVVTAGGRVLGVTARGRSLEDARQAAQAAADRLSFPGVQRRRDIGLTGPSGAGAR